MVVLIDDNDAIILITCNAGWQICVSIQKIFLEKFLNTFILLTELAVSRSLSTKLELESSVTKENLNSVVSSVGNDDFIVFRYTTTPRARNFSVVMTVKAET
jgi:hypothetical protein